MELVTNYVMYIANNVSGIAVEYITGTSNLLSNLRASHISIIIYVLFKYHGSFSVETLLQ
jgi:hypothetical protein